MGRLGQEYGLRVILLNVSRILTVVAVAAGFSVSLRATPAFIVPTFDSTITSDSNAATIMATINAAIAIYQATFSNPISVAIKFQEGGGLGSSSTWIGSVSYSSYLTALGSHATSANDATALAHLPVGPNNPVNANSSVELTTANLRALGFTGNPGDSWDGTITLNTSIMNLTRPPGDGSKYDLQAVVMHEIDEVLGIGSRLNNVAQGGAAPSTPVFGMDLYRYVTGSTTRSYNTTLSTNASFSIDGGATDLVGFNQNAGGDFSDWLSVPGSPKTQDAFGTAGAVPSYGVEITALDVLGYTLAAPEPSSFVLMSFALLGLAGLRRRVQG
jgi:hypothetical protein